MGMVTGTEKISTTFAESSLNQVVSKRMVKQQEMRGSDPARACSSAHEGAQARTPGDLRPVVSANGDLTGDAN
jgi:hypothetical protein